MNRPDYRPVHKVEINDSEAYTTAIELVIERFEGLLDGLIGDIEKLPGIRTEPQVVCGIIVNGLIGCIAKGVNSIHDLNGYPDEEEHTAILARDIEVRVNQEMKRTVPYHNHN